MAKLTKLLVQISLLIDAIVFHLNICWYYAGKLFRFLMHGTTTWMYMLWKLCVFAGVLMPGWYRMVSYWMWSPLIIRNIEYGDGVAFRNVLDIYLPSPVNPRKGAHTVSGSKLKQPRRDINGVPVVILVSGGAWIIGYKLWSALIARGIAHLGVVVVVPDYRNFPQGDIEDMMADIRHAVHWTIYNAHSFGGNANKIVLAGQSAGAHISLCMLVEEYLCGRGEHSSKTKTKKVDEQPGTLSPVVLSAFSVGGEGVAAVGAEEGAAPNSPLPMVTKTPSDSDWARSFDNEELNPHVWRDVGPDEVDIQAPQKAKCKEYTREKGTGEGEGGRLGAESSNSGTSSVTGFGPVTTAAGVNRSAVTAATGTCTGTGTGTPASISISVETMSSPQSTSCTPEPGSRHRSVSSAIDMLWRQSVDVLDPEWRQEVQKSISGQSSRELYAPELDRPLLQSMSQTAIGSMETQLNAARASTGAGVATSSAVRPRRASVTTKSSTSIASGNIPAIFGTPAANLATNTTAVSPAAFATALEVEASNTVSTAGELLSSPGRSTARLCKDNLKLASTPASAADEEDLNIFDHVKLYIGISGPYNLSRMVDHFHSRGLDSSILNYMCRDNVAKYSPSERLAAHTNSRSNSSSSSSSSNRSYANGGSEMEQHQSAETTTNASLHDFLPVVLIHGSHDITLPTSSSTELADVLRAGGASHDKVIYREYAGWTHTDAIVEGPLSGNMRLAKDVVGFAQYFTSSAQTGRGREGEEDDGTSRGNSSTSSNSVPTTPIWRNMQSNAATTTVIPAPVIVACNGRHNCGDNIVGERQPDDDVGGEREGGMQSWWKLPASFSADVDDSLSMVHPSLVAIARRCNPF